MHPVPRLWLITHVAGLALGRAAAAQTAPLPSTAPAVNPRGDEVVQLTPFQVNTGDNTGWAPTETLAGTRFKTKLSDLASQIDVPAIGAKANSGDRVFSTSGDGAISVIGGNNPAGQRPMGWFHSVGMQPIADNGRWRGLSTRSPAAIGFGAKRINGVVVPDVNVILNGKAETAVDLSFAMPANRLGSATGGMVCA